MRASYRYDSLWFAAMDTKSALITCVLWSVQSKYHINVPDRGSACAPGNSAEAQNYYQAMACAVNYAFANRQAIMHGYAKASASPQTRPEKIGLNLVYDVAHNIAKIENHQVGDGAAKRFGFTAKAQHEPSQQDTLTCQQTTAVKGNQCLSPAAWAPARGCCWAVRRLWS